MTEETDKFVEEMLEKVKNKKETKPQTRTQGVDKEEVANMAENLWKIRKKKSSD
ncbi:hypothetical protein KY331_03455 [Candidatus Woesearchaeota archaeon]|nr:hypothetical protein [Candidatus Woesearchaeota archaeon]